jgi:hypothetical protein
VQNFLSGAIHPDDFNSDFHGDKKVTLGRVPTQEPKLVCD